MARRSQDWNEGLAKDLRDPEFAQAFILACIDEGMTVQQALAKAIRSFGVKEFAAKVKMPSSNVIRAIDRRYNPTQDTLNRLLKPFGLCVSIARIESDRKRKAS